MTKKNDKQSGMKMMIQNRSWLCEIRTLYKHIKRNERWKRKVKKFDSFFAIIYDDDHLQLEKSASLDNMNENEEFPHAESSNMYV